MAYMGELARRARLGACVQRLGPTTFQAARGGSALRPWIAEA